MILSCYRLVYPLNDHLHFLEPLVRIIKPLAIIKPFLPRKPQAYPQSSISQHPSQSSCKCPESVEKVSAAI